MHKNNARQQKSQIEIEACKFVNHNQHTHSKFLNRECLGVDREEAEKIFPGSIVIQFELSHNRVCMEWTERQRRASDSVCESEWDNASEHLLCDSWNKQKIYFGFFFSISISANL